MKIPAIYSSFGYTTPLKKEQKNKQIPEYSSNSTELRAQFNDYLLNFGARVDKGMNRFYNENKDRMPAIVRDLIEPLPNREVITPLEAQYYAYQKLEDAVTVDDIKDRIPEEKEPLFANLKEASQTKARTGLLYSMREMSELYGDNVLKTDETLTTYLVKKVFLETKTIDEINEDLENDLNDDFKIYHKNKRPDSPFVRSSTLSALGIKMPDMDYMQSLRYTREGYSDMVGAKISKGINKFLSSLTPEQRTARAVSSVRKFEKWWNSLTHDEKLDLIAKNEVEMEMLKAYRRNNRAEKKRLKEAGIDIESTEEDTVKEPKTHTRVGSKELSKDELFKMWATQNLKKYEASLTQADKDTLHLKRMANLFNRWKNMTAAERTDYISKMKTGAEPARYAMIYAWNECPDVLQALYLHLKENQVYKPADLLYSSEGFSQFQSKVMTEFWDKHPEFAEKLGDKIHLGHLKIENAIRNGNFEELKNMINRNKNQRKKELDAYKKSLETPVEEPVVPAQELDYKEEFKQSYFKNSYGLANSVPKKYFDDVYSHILEILPEDIVRLWTKSLKGESLTSEEVGRVQDALKEDKHPEIARCNRAFEAAMADTIYACTNNPRAYELSNSDVKVVMYHIERGESPIKVVSHKNNQTYEFEIVNKRRIDMNRINMLYESYKKDLSDDEISEILMYGFYPPQKPEHEIVKAELLDYIKSYGRSLNVIFSDKSAYPPDVKTAFSKKFLYNMPDHLLKSGVVRPRTFDMEYNTQFGHASNLFARRFPFLPKEIVTNYFKEFKIMLEPKCNEKDFNLSEFLQKICKRRTEIASHGSISIMPKSHINDERIKYQMLAMEQAMADVLYDATGNEDVYKIGFEMLCDKLELFSMVKNFPSASSPVIAVDNKNVELSVKKKINLAMVQKKYREYMKEISEWLDEIKGVKPDYQDLLYILNPEENNTVRDINCGLRMASYFSSDDGFKFTIDPNPFNDVK